MWQFVYKSVIGTSHQKDDAPCQDACRVIEVACDQDEILVCVCADGAGSVPFAAEGAETACEQVAILCSETLSHESSLESFSEAHAREWCEFLRERLQQLANSLQAGLDDLACTLLVALVGQRRSCFFQIGDGGIVFRSEGEFQLVFNPAHGEYAETTYFLTDPDFAESIQYGETRSPIDGIAVFTDGLERLLLTHPNPEPHHPFFQKAFLAVEESEDEQELESELSEFLGASQVNQRTSDDKSLILAVRRCDQKSETKNDAASL